jgi:hypothetical protein
MIIKKIIKYYLEHGIEMFFYKILNKVGFKVKYVNYTQKIKKNLELILLKKFKNTIQTGCYAGAKIIPKLEWYKYDLNPKLLGTYEIEVQNEIKNLKNKIETIIAIGSAEGYHLVGSIKNKLSINGVAFEANQESLKLLKENAKKNKVYKKINYFGNADKNFLKKIPNTIKLNKTLFLIDVEGSEYMLLSDKNLKKIKNSFLIIEIHTSTAKKLIKLKRNINKYFYFREFNSSLKNRSLENIKFINKFSDDERLLMLSEGRNYNMSWIIATPK